MQSRECRAGSQSEELRLQLCKVWSPRSSPPARPPRQLVLKLARLSSSQSRSQQHRVSHLEAERSHEQLEARARLKLSSRLPWAAERRGHVRTQFISQMFTFQKKYKSEQAQNKLVGAHFL